MKRILPYILLPLLLLVLVSAYVPDYFVSKSSLKELEKNMVKLSDTLYIHRYETSNLEYRQFLIQLSKRDTALYRMCLYDSLDWDHYLWYNTSYMSDYYYQYPGYRYMAVSAIRYEAAEQYCQYLTKEYNQNRHRKFNKVKFRLPTEEEWLQATGKYKDSLYANGNDSLNAKGVFQYCFYYNAPGFSPDHFEGTSIRLAPGPDFVFSEYPNEKGIHHLSGNISEMIVEKGKAMGGSFWDHASEVRMNTVFYYDKPTVTIGFRYVMEIVEK